MKHQIFSKAQIMGKQILIPSFLLLFVFNLSSQTSDPHQIKVSTIPSSPQVNSPYQVVVNASFNSCCQPVYGYNVTEKDSVATLKVYYDGMGAVYSFFGATSDTISVSNFAAGTTKIIAHAYSVYGLNSPTDTSEITASDTIYTNTTGINEFLLGDAIKIHLNPAKGIIHVETEGNIHLTSLILMDNQGKKINEYKKDERELNIAELPSGIYFLNMQTEKGEVMEKIVVQ